MSAEKKPATRFKKRPSRCDCCYSVVKKQVYQPKLKLYADHCKKCGHTVDLK